MVSRAQSGLQWTVHFTLAPVTLGAFVLESWALCWGLGAGLGMVVVQSTPGGVGQDAGDSPGARTAEQRLLGSDGYHLRADREQAGARASHLRPADPARKLTLQPPSCAGLNQLREVLWVPGRMCFSFQKYVPFT